MGLMEQASGLPRLIDTEKSKLFFFPGHQNGETTYQIATLVTDEAPNEEIRVACQLSDKQVEIVREKVPRYVLLKDRSQLATIDNKSESLE